MLSNLMKLSHATLSLTTSENGQVNLAIFKKGTSTPLALTFDGNDATAVYNASQEVLLFCQHMDGVQTTTNLDAAVKTETVSQPKAAKGKAKPTAASAPTSTEEAVAEPTPEPQEESAEDDLLAEFGL